MFVQFQIRIHGFGSMDLDPWIRNRFERTMDPRLSMDLDPLDPLTSLPTVEMLMEPMDPDPWKVSDPWFFRTGSGSMDADPWIHGPKRSMDPWIRNHGSGSMDPNLKMHEHDFLKLGNFKILKKF